MKICILNIQGIICEQTIEAHSHVTRNSRQSTKRKFATVVSFWRLEPTIPITSGLSTGPVTSAFKEKEEVFLLQRFSIRRTKIFLSCRTRVSYHKNIWKHRHCCRGYSGVRIWDEDSTKKREERFHAMITFCHA